MVGTKRLRAFATVSLLVAMASLWATSAAAHEGAHASEASARAGDVVTSREAYGALARNWRNADPSAPAVAEVRSQVSAR